MGVVVLGAARCVCAGRGSQVERGGARSEGAGLPEADVAAPARPARERPGPEPRGVRPTARVWREIWRPLSRRWR